MSKKKVNKFLLIGWDAAEWKVMEPMMEAGLMPTLKKFLNEGVSGRIATLDPPFSPMLWTSIATGKRAYDHGIMGFIEPTPNGDGLRPVLCTSRKVKAIWNILNQEGYKSNVIGWWPSHPAEPINGIMVSNFYQNFKERIDKPWGLPDGAIHPAELTDKFKEMRVHADEITVSLIDNFVPNVKDLLEKYIPIDQDKETDKELKKRAEAYIQRITGISKNIAMATSIHSAGTYAMQNTEWDFMAVYYDFIDHISHIAMKFHPPQMKGLDDDAFLHFQHVVTAGYRFQDMMLERTLSLIDEDTTVMILSDHGFHPDNLRPRKLPNEPASPALEHSPYGMIAIKGPGIKKGEKIFGASLMDITPTLLHLYGLPVAKDMEGKVLMQIFDEKNIDEIEWIESWEKVEGNDGQHSDDKQLNTWAGREAMQQLIELGYVDKPDDNIGKAVEDATAEAKYYLARNYINGNKYKEAYDLLEELFASRPDTVRYAIRLANVCLNTRRFKRCQEIIDHIKNLKDIPDFKVKFIEGLLCLNTFKTRKGVKILNKLKEKSISPNIFLHLGRANNQRYRWVDAEEAFKTAINLDPYNNLSHHGLGVSYLRRGKYEEALDSFFNAVEIYNDMPQTHFCLGETLMKMEYYDKAIEAFKVALYFQPNMVRAHFWLGEIYEKMGNKDLADEHKNIGKQYAGDEKLIVTGLQRSGTSLMMKLLQEYGCDLLYDNLKKPDEFNPDGYFEYEPAMNILNNKNWLENMDGKIVKIYAQGIPELPKKYSYRIIWMERNMNDILKSFNKAHGVKKQAFNTEFADKMSQQVDKSQTWIESMPNVEMKIVNYDDLIEFSIDEFKDVLSFLDIEIDDNKIEKIVKNVINKEKTIRN